MISSAGDNAWHIVGLADSGTQGLSAVCCQGIFLGYRLLHLKAQASNHSRDLLIGVGAVKGNHSPPRPLKGKTGHVAECMDFKKALVWLRSDRERGGPYVSTFRTGY